MIMIVVLCMVCGMCVCVCVCVGGCDVWSVDVRVSFRCGNVLAGLSPKLISVRVCLQSGNEVWENGRGRWNQLSTCVNVNVNVEKANKKKKEALCEKDEKHKKKKMKREPGLRIKK